MSLSLKLQAFLVQGSCFVEHPLNHSKVTYGNFNPPGKTTYATYVVFVHLTRLHVWIQNQRVSQKELAAYAIS